MSNIDINTAAAVALPDLINTARESSPDQMVDAVSTELVGELQEENFTQESVIEQHTVPSTAHSQTSEDLLASDVVDVVDDPEMVVEKEMILLLQRSMNQFNEVLASEDSYERVQKTYSDGENLLDSPLIHSQVNEGYFDQNSLDSDILELGVGMPISRSGSIESFDFELAKMNNSMPEHPRLVTPEPPRNSGEKLKEETISADPSATVVESQTDRKTIIQTILKNLERKDYLTARNAVLQNKLAEYFKKKRNDESKDVEKSASDQEAKYLSILSVISDLQKESKSTISANEKSHEEFLHKVQHKAFEVSDKVESFYKYKRAVALAATSSRTGKPMPASTFEQLEATEKKKETEVIAARLEHIKLRNKLKRQEAILRQKEELADGLHLIDFEQLKIENQAYNEKIEGRNEELQKLTKKITNVVQVLSHVKEKLQFTESEAEKLQGELKALDSEVARQRDTLPILKIARDRLRANNNLLRQQHGLLGNEQLLADYGINMDETKKLKMQISKLQDTHTKLVEETITIRRKIQKSQLVTKLTSKINNQLAM